MIGRLRQEIALGVYVPFAAVAAGLASKPGRAQPTLEAHPERYLWPDLLLRPIPHASRSQAITGVYAVSLMSSAVTPDQVKLPKGSEFAPECQGNVGKCLAAIGMGFQTAVRPSWAPPQAAFRYPELAGAYPVPGFTPFPPIPYRGEACATD